MPRHTSTTPPEHAAPEAACLCCRRTPSSHRTTRRPLPREAELGWERAAYLVLDARWQA